MEEQIEQAISLVQAGDLNAYTIVVDAYQRRLRASVASRCPPTVDPDEVAHVAFIEAYKRIDQYELGTEFYVWLWVFARNTLLAYIQKAKRTKQNRENLVNRMVIERLEGELQGEVPPEDFRLEALKACMRKLSEEARELLSMRYDKSVSLKTVSEAMGRSVAALKFQLFATRRSLRDCVQKTLAEIEA